MSGGDGMDSNTQVPIVKCVWVLVAMSIVSSIQCHCLPRTWLQWLFPVLKSPEE
jgi:hypothetical protein